MDVVTFVSQNIELLMVILGFVVAAVKHSEGMKYITKTQEDMGRSIDIHKEDSFKIIQELRNETLKKLQEIKSEQDGKVKEMGADLKTVSQKLSDHLVTFAQFTQKLENIDTNVKEIKELLKAKR